MDKNQWRQIEKIFYSAMELPPGERDDFVGQACADDEELRQEVRALLAANRDAASFLDSPVAMPPHSGALSPALVMLQAKSNSTSAAENGIRVGSYRLLREIGRGGMGAVWLAERADGQFRQQVAIKLLHAGAEDEEISRRFRHERQILASLDHPNIARLHDGGTAEDGRPYFVMERIEGLPIDEYCRQRQLSVNDRLRLFRQVCAAVHYAHQHLVIHRDLKPSNIVVTADGAPKLLDFGIAKLIQPDLSRSYDTLSDVTPMTPAYASPEQARGEKLTTASDVYSLGVVLYELLTGRSPYRLKANTFGELMRAVVEQEPERPSTAITRADDEPSAAPVTIEPPDKLRRRLAGDVDSIALMALRKEPGARYGSVEQFSEDIRRYLEGLPTIARKGTFGYRAAKYLRRNRIPAAAAVLILLTLFGGIFATLRQARIALAAQHHAEAEQTKAESQRRRAEDALAIAEDRRQQAEVARAEAVQQRTEAEAQREMADEQRAFADGQRQRAETQELSNRRLLYTSRIGLAQQAWENSNIGRMRELLDFYLPQAGEPDFRSFEWRYLWRLCHREVKTLADAGNNAGVAYSQDGKTLLTLSLTRDAVTFYLEVIFRDAATWQVLSAQKYQFNGADGIVALAHHTDKVAVGFHSDAIRVFSFTDFKEQSRIAGFPRLRSMDISDSGKLIAAGSFYGTIHLYDAATGKLIRTFDGHQQQINMLKFSPDEQTLVSAGYDRTVWLWDVNTGKTIRALKQGGPMPYSALFTPNGNAVIAAGAGEMKVWETATGKEIASRSLGSGWAKLAISPDGKTLATGDAQPVIRLWDTQTWQERFSIKGHGHSIKALSFTPDGARLASGSSDQTVRIWDLSRNQRDVISLSDPPIIHTKALFLPDGQRIVSASGVTGIATIWDSVSGKKLRQLKGHTKPDNATGNFVGLAVSPNGRWIATGGMDGVIKIWDATTGQDFRTFSKLGTRPNVLAFSDDSRLIAVGSVEQVWVYDISTGQERMKVRITGGTVFALLFMPDNKTLLTGGLDYVIRFWDVATARVLKEIKWDQSAIFSMALSPDQSYIATGSTDSSVAVWDVHTGKRVYMFKGHSSLVNDVSFSPDGRRIVSGSNDQTVKLWDLVSGQEMITWRELGDAVGSVRFSSDNQRLLAACGKTVNIWPAASEQEARAKMR